MRLKKFILFYWASSALTGFAQYQENLPQAKLIPPNAAAMFKVLERPIGAFAGTIPNNIFKHLKLLYMKKYLYVGMIAFCSLSSSQVQSQNPFTYLEIDNSNADGGRLIFKSTGYGEWRARNFLGSLGFFPGEGNATVLWLASTGNVGIGTTSASEKLTVNGNILSKKVKVTQSGWPDYVFSPFYRLRPLSEVELFIRQKQHLPEVPSAAEVEKDGIDLGDNQATLLKKIEELTLYIISLNKDVEALKKEIRQIQGAIPNEN